MSEHHAAAIELLKTSDELPLIHAGTAATQALVEATLALAYEQRTANLIAFERNMIEARRGGNLSADGRELWSAASKESIERLGLA